MLHTTGVNLCPSIDYLERAWQDALAGRPAAEPYVEAELPSAIDSSLTDDGRWVMTMFTQYGPPDEEAWEGGARERYARRLRRAPGPVRAQRPGRDRRARGAGAAGPRADLRPSGRHRSSRASRASTRWRSCAPSPDLAQYATPVDGLYLCGAGTHPGGGVMAAAGHNAAQRILRDRRVGRLRGPAATPSRPSRRGTSRGTELRETELISAHLSVPGVAQHEPTERLQGFS